MEGGRESCLQSPRGQSHADERLQPGWVLGKGRPRLLCGMGGDRRAPSAGSTGLPP